MFLLLNQVYTLAPNTVTNLDSFFKRQGFAVALHLRSAAKFPFLF